MQYTAIMEIVVKVIIVLTVATVADPSSSKPAQNGLKLKDPKLFECNQASPTSKLPVFSTTTPHVALTHIFCGEIKEGKAEGFHSRYLVDINSKRQHCARTIGSITCNRTTCPKCPFSAEGIELLHVTNKGKYKSRKANENRPQTFFPDDWDPPFIVKLAQDIYDHCMSNSMLENGKACLKDYKIPDSDNCPKKTTNIKIHINKQKITSAYPSDKLYDCDRNCTFSESYYTTPAAKPKDLQPNKWSHSSDL